MIEGLYVNEADKNVEDYDAIKEAISKLSTASQDQFETIKSEKWYNRVFDMVTFSNKKEIRIADQIRTIAQAQQIFIELLLRLSDKDTAISQIVSTSMVDIRKLSSQNIDLLLRIKQLENITLGIKSEMDINKLTSREKQLLSGCLYKINEILEKTSDAQKIYADSVLTYVSTDVQVDNIEVAFVDMSSEAKKCILTCCMEYLFLWDCLEESFHKTMDSEDISEFVDEFDLGKKTIKGIEEHIFKLFELRGRDGFYSKYNSINFEQINTDFSVDIEIRDTDLDNEKGEFEEFTISSIMDIPRDKEEIIKNKIIHPRAFIKCEGSLVIDHCILYFNENDVCDEISLVMGSSFSIRDSVVICKGYSKKFFISTTNDSKNEKLINVVFENTTFINCVNFLELDYFHNAIFNNCKFENCDEGFLKLSMDGMLDDDTRCVSFENNEIIKDSDVSSKWIPHSEYNTDTHKMIEISSSLDRKSIVFRNNNIVEKENSKVEGVENIIIDAQRAELYNCTFKGLSKAILARKVSDCQFEQCKQAVELNWVYSEDDSDEKATISKCTFIDCSDVVKVHTSSIIQQCQFVRCYNSIISGDEGTKVEYCEFYDTFTTKEYGNYIDNDACISMMRSSKSDRINEIKKCRFYGVDISTNNTYLIHGRVLENESIAVNIDSCEFRNCITKDSSGDIIGEYDTYWKKIPFKEVQFNCRTVDIVDCIGLDEVNKGHSHADSYDIRNTGFETENGSDIIGAPTWIIDFVGS